MPFCPMYLIMRSKFSGVQVKNVRIHQVWSIINKSGKVIHPTLPVPRQKHPSIVRYVSNTRFVPRESDSSNNPKAMC